MGHPIAGQRLGRPNGLAVPLVQGRHQGLLAARRNDQSRAVDQQAFAHRPGDVLSLESFQRVERPKFLARGRIEARHAAVGVHVIELAFGIRAAGPRAG